MRQGNIGGRGGVYVGACSREEDDGSVTAEEAVGSPVQDGRSGTRPGGEGKGAEEVGNDRAVDGVRCRVHSWLTDGGGRAGKSNTVSDGGARHGDFEVCEQ